MDDRRITGRHAIRQATVARAALLGRLHHQDHFREKGLCARAGDADFQRAIKVEHAGQKLAPGHHGRRHRLAGYHCGVDIALSGQDDPVERHAFSWSDDYGIAHRYAVERHKCP